MLNLIVNSTKGKVNLNLPTSLSEITKEYLENVTKDIHVANNYSIIAICYREKISKILSTLKQNKNTLSSSIIPLFIKSGETCSDFIKSINTKDKLAISGSNISLALHAVSTKNILSINSIIDIVNSDKELMKNAFNITDYCYFVEFKIIPNCDIQGFYSNDSTNEDWNNPYIEFKEEV